MLNIFFMQVLFALVSAAVAAPQILPYVHQEVEAEPYIHQEIEAEPYVHLEPALAPEALGETNYAFAPQVAAFAPADNVIAYSNNGLCRNNLGSIVPCAL